MRAIEMLRERIDDLEMQRRFDGKCYPQGLARFPGVLTGQGFFPGGDGLWRTKPQDGPPHSFPVDGVMILGNDFGCADNDDPRSPGFNQCLARGYEDPPTWRIKDTLRSAGVPGTECFFTNSYLGLREGRSSTGRTPGLADGRFQVMCREFFDYQLEIQRPRLIICLGHEPRKFLAPGRRTTIPAMIDGLDVWRKNSISLTEIDRRCPAILQGTTRLAGGAIRKLTLVLIAHPSFAWSAHTQWPRVFNGKAGKEAEIELLSEAWRIAGS